MRFSLCISLTVQTNFGIRHCALDQYLPWDVVSVILESKLVFR